MIVCSILAFLTPWVAEIGGSTGIRLMRGFQGFTQGYIFPCTHALLSQWTPLSERGRLAAFAYAGGQLGIVAMFGLSGIIISSVIRWPGIFYFSGGSGILWSIIWFIFGANNPKQSKWISLEEKEFLLNSIGSNILISESIPFKDIITSIPFIALIFAHIGHMWGFWTLLTCIPLYMKTVLKYDYDEVALYSALPFLACWILSFFFSFISDTLNNKNILTPQRSRKLFNTIGHWGPALILISIGYITKENRIVAVVLVIFALGINSASYVGFMVVLKVYYEIM